MNLGTLSVLAASFANDPQQTRYSASYTSYLNLAQQQFALDTHCLYKNQQYSIVSGTSTYALPTDFIYERWVQFSPDGLQQIKLIADTRAELFYLSTGNDWTQNTGQTRRYIIEPEQSNKTIRIWPSPTDAEAGTNNLTMQYYYLPPDMVNSGDIPLDGSTLLAQFHIALAAWTAHYFLMGENQTPEISAKMDRLWKLYSDRVIDAIDKFGDTRSQQIRLKGGRYW